MSASFGICLFLVWVDVSASFVYTRGMHVVGRCVETSVSVLPTTSGLKEELVSIATELASNGVFLYDKGSKNRLQKAVFELEAVSSLSSEVDFPSLYRGDWKLICTTSTNTEGFNEGPIPFLNEGPFKSLRRSISSCIEIRQRIRCMNNGNTIDRVDNVVEIMPANQLSGLVDGLPDPLASLTINPLEVTKAKFTLIHKAEIESFEPVPKTKISLESVVLTAAGSSQFLEPKGTDILGLNLPLGEFLNSGSFETTYIDNDIRISRGRLGLIDQLRVFSRIVDQDGNHPDTGAEGVAITDKEDLEASKDE